VCDVCLCVYAWFYGCVVSGVCLCLYVCCIVCE